MKAVQLYLCFRACTLNLIHGVLETLNDWGKIRRVKPYWRDDNGNPENHFQYPAPKCIAAHAMEHAIILLHEAIQFFVAIVAVGFHKRIVSLLCPRQESNLDSRVRSAKFYPLNYESVRDKSILPVNPRIRQCVSFRK